MRKRFLAMLLCLCVVVTMLPTTVFADDIEMAGIQLGTSDISDPTTPTDIIEPTLAAEEEATEIDPTENTENGADSDTTDTEESTTVPDTTEPTLTAGEEAPELDPTETTGNETDGDTKESTTAPETPTEDAKDEKGNAGDDEANITIPEDAPSELDDIEPTLTAGEVSRTSDTSAMVRFTSDEEGQYYYAVVDSGEEAPEIDTEEIGTDCDTEEQTIALDALTAGEKDIYIVVKDEEGNVSDNGLKITIPEYATPEPDITAPTLTAGEVSRTSDTTATVRFTSDEEGQYYYAVASISEADAPEIDTEEIGTDCDTEEQTITLDTLTAGEKDIYIVVKDEAGNVSDDGFKITISEYAAPELAAIALTLTAEAPDYTLYYNKNDGKLYRDDKYNSPVDGLAGWSGSGSTLTLNNFDFTTSAATALMLPADVTLELQGESTVQSTVNGASDDTYGIYVTGDLTVTGTGSLTATGGAAGGNSYGVYADGSIIVEDGMLMATGGTSEGWSSRGVYATGKVTVKGGTLMATGGTSEGSSWGVDADGSITVKGGTLTATGGAAGSYSHGVTASDIIEVSGGTLTATSGEAFSISYALSSKPTLNYANGYLWRASIDGSVPADYTIGEYIHNDTYKYFEIKPATVTYTVTLDKQSGTGGDDSVTATVGDVMPAVTPPTRENYSFMGYFDAATGGTKYYNADGTSAKTWDKTANTTLYAQWTAVPPTTYALTVNLNGGSGGGITYNYYTITASAGTGGSISPSGSVSVPQGRDKTFNITPKDGYVLSDVLADGVSVKNKLLNNTYTFENVYYRHTIQATFIEKSKVNPDTGVVNPFTDVTESDWFFEDVMFVYGNKFMLGTSDTTFGPNDTTTSAMIATILWRMEGSPEVTGSSGFTDVPEGKYYTDAITWAKQNDIVKGYSDTLFGLDAPMTREQLAAFFYRYAQYKGCDTTISGSTSSFMDTDKVSDWAADAMKWAVGYGVIQGKTGNLLDPQGDATRAQLTAMLHRLIVKNGLVEGVTATGLMGWIDPRRLNISKTTDMAGAPGLS